MRGYRFTLSPKWVIGHLIVVALAVTTTLLGHWQLTVSDRKHFAPQNFGYALQWWAFTLFGIAMWIKIIHDHARSIAAKAGGAPPPPPVVAEPEVAYRRYVMPQGGAAHGTLDDTHAAYNDYLGRLHARAEQPEERTSR